MKHSKKPKKIATRLILSFLAVSFLPLVAAGYVSYRITEASLKEDVVSGLLAITQSKAKSIETYAVERRRNVAALSHDPTVTRAMERYSEAFRTSGIDSPEYDAIDKELRPFLTYYQESGYYDLFLISPAGDVVFAVIKEDDFGTNLRTGPYKSSELAKVFDRANTLLETEMSDFRYYPPSDEPAAFVAAPILKKRGLLGVVALQISPEEIYDHARDYTGLGETGEIVIASRKEEQAVFVTPVRHDPGAAFKRSIEIGSEAGLPVQEAVQAKKGHGVSVDYRGKAVLAAWRHLPSFRWGMVAKIDAVEAFAPINDLRNWWVALGIMATALVILLALAFSRAISVPLVRLTRMTQRIASGDLGARVDVHSTDEVGQLANAFNTMTGDLKRSRDELEQEITERKRAEEDLRKAHGELEVRVRERTAELARSNAELEQFAYVASHDLQEPLRMIASYVQLLERRYKDKLDTDANTFIAFAVDGATRMQTLINDLLAYSRVGSRGEELAPTCCETALLQALMNLMAKIEETGAKVTHDPLPTVMGDEGQLTQLFQNLIGNAIKFRGEEPPKIHVTADRPQTTDHNLQSPIRNPKCGFSPCAITASVSTPVRPSASSRFFSACTHERNIPAPGSVWPSAEKSSNATAAASGSSRSREKEVRSTSQ